MGVSGLFFSYIIWWYSSGLEDYIEFASHTLLQINSNFDFRGLVFSLFEPFKRDYSSAGAGLDWKQVVMNNLISRFIGALIRLGIIFGGIVMLGFATFVLCIGGFIWLSLPVIIIMLTIYGFVLLFGGSK